MTIAYAFRPYSRPVYKEASREKVMAGYPNPLSGSAAGKRLWGQYPKQYGKQEECRAGLEGNEYRRNKSEAVAIKTLIGS